MTRWRFINVGVLLTLIGLHLCVWFSSWPHGQGDTWFDAALIDTFLIFAVTSVLVAVEVENA